MFQDIELTDLLRSSASGTHTIIDVRSPREFNEVTIPGSINIPVFDNAERAEVGTLYKQVGPEAAKERGLAIFSEKLPSFIKAFENINTPKTVFCWRGGMRSKTAATVLDLMGISVTRLSGGIRTYRQWVVRELEKACFKPKLFVLNGYTGAGKTILLKKLSELGHPVIDLEAMAGHRGSIFGQIGLEPSNQKKFDAFLVEEMLRYKDAPYVFIEGESKRIGKVQLPDFLYEQKENGVQIFVDLPIGERVKNLLDDYQPWKYPNLFKDAFQIIKKRVDFPIAKQIEADLEKADFDSVTALLLTHYYDPRYEYAIKDDPENREILIKAAHVDDALQLILEQLAHSDKLKV